MDVLYFFRVLLKRKWLIIGSALLAAVVAYMFTKKEVKMYKSTTRISTGFSMMDEIKISNDNFNLMEADNKFNNALVTFQSPSVISMLSYRLILHDLQDPHPFRPLKPAQKNSDIYKSIKITDAVETFENKLRTISILTSFKPEEKQLLEFLKLYGYDYQSLSENLSIYRLQHTDYIQVDFKSENPLLSAFVANDVFNQFQRYYTSMRSQKSTESLDTLQSLLEKKKVELDSINTSLRALGILDPTVESTSKFEQVTQLESSLSDEKSKLTNLQYSLEKVNQKLNKQPAAKAAAGTTNDELLLARRAMNDAYSEYLQSGSTDQAAFNKYNRLKTAYQSKVAEYSSSKTEEVVSSGSDASLQEKKSDLEVDIAAARQNISSLEGRINSTKSNISQDASKNVEVAALLKEADLANKEYLAAKEKLNAATDVKAALNNFRQVLVAQPAIEPEPSKKLVIVALAGTCTLVLCILVIALLTYLDFSLKTPDVFARSVNLKLITMVNLLNLKNNKVVDLVSASTAESEYQPTDVRRSNVFRESIRKLRFEVESSGKKIFLFTSARKGEGKTTLIQALAYSLSHSKKKVLVIDTNFCNNDLTVQMNAEPMLDKIRLTGENNNIIEQVKASAFNSTDMNVFTIGCESGDYTPSEVLPDNSILYNLRKLTEEYDYILLEGPPLNDFSDSKELARHVDGVIAIFGANHSIKQIDTDSIDFFKSMNGKFCGAVLNKVVIENIKLS